MGVGTAVSLWRYPVKSMMAEELNASEDTERGLVGDRACALIDSSTGMVVSDKDPRKWKQLYDCRATYSEAPSPHTKLPSVRITLPDGNIVTSEQSDIDQIFSALLNRDVTFRMPAPTTVALEEYWPDIEGLVYRETVTEEAMPSETFFDLAVVHVL